MRDPWRPRHGKLGKEKRLAPSLSLWNQPCGATTEQDPLRREHPDKLLSTELTCPRHMAESLCVHLLGKLRVSMAVADIFISHSSEDPADSFPRELRRALCRKLEENGHTPLVAEGAIEGGELWRPKICHWLARCHGAVILFSDAAVSSDWVIAESLILCWRRSLYRDLLIVPVLFPGVTLQHTQFHSYTPFQLEEIQALPIAKAPRDTASDYEEQIGSIVEDIVTCLGRLSTVNASDRMDTWRRRVASYMQSTVDYALIDCERVLGDEDALFCEFGEDRRLALANLLLHADWGRAYQAIRELSPVMLEEQLSRLIKSLVPSVVPLAATRNIVPLSQLPDARDRNIAVRARMQQTARLLINRAFCCDSKVIIISMCEVFGEESAEYIARRYEAAMLRKLRVSPDEARKEEELKRRIDASNKLGDVWFVLFGEAAIRKGVPKMLRERFREMTFLILCGDTVPNQDEVGLPFNELTDVGRFIESEEEMNMNAEMLSSLCDRDCAGIGGIR